MDLEKCSFRHHTLSESSASHGSEMLQPQGGASPVFTPRGQVASLGGGASRQGAGPRHPKRSAWEVVYLIPSRTATALLALLQGLVIDCYLIRYNSTYCYAWIAADVAVLLMFFGAFFISYRQMALVMRRYIISTAPTTVGGASLLGPAQGGGAGGVISRMSPAPDGGEVGLTGTCCISALRGEDYTLEKGEIRSAGSMPLVYFAWLVYSALLAIRVLLIYYNFAHQLAEEAMLGVNTLHTTVSGTALVFVLLLLAHHDAAPESRRRHRIDALTCFVVFDILDAVDLLGVLTTPTARDAMATWLTWSVLGVACFNLVLPTVPLMALSRTQFGARRLPEFYQTLHHLLVLFVINAPLLGTRLLLWHHLKVPVSPFLIKNVVVGSLVLYSFYERDHHKRLKDRVLNQI